MTLLAVDAVELAVRDGTHERRSRVRFETMPGLLARVIERDPAQILMRWADYLNATGKDWRQGDVVVLSLPLCGDRSDSDPVNYYSALVADVQPA